MKEVAEEQKKRNTPIKKHSYVIPSLEQLQMEQETWEKNNPNYWKECCSERDKDDAKVIFYYI